MLNSLLNNPLFARSSIASELRAKPLGFVDVGTRGGIHPIIEPLAHVTCVLGFEPDEIECARIRAEQHQGPWSQFEVEPIAIAGSEREHAFHVCERPINSSLLRPNPSIAERYHSSGYRIVRSVTLQTRSLDGVLFELRSTQDYQGELLKLDAQGAELDILNGATRTLKERTVAALVEVEFCQLYENQPLFSEVELFMRERGFGFFGFNCTSYRSGRFRHLLKDRGAAWRERLLHADAVFFRDPLAAHCPTLSKRQKCTLYASAMLLGYFDFAAEVAQNAWSVETEAHDLLILAEQYARGLTQ